MKLEPSLALGLVTATEDALAAGDTRVGLGPDMVDCESIGRTTPRTGTPRGAAYSSTSVVRHGYSVLIQLSKGVRNGQQRTSPLGLMVGRLQAGASVGGIRTVRRSTVQPVRTSARARSPAPQSRASPRACATRMPRWGSIGILRSIAIAPSG